MVTIITRYIGPTNTRGSRIIAQRSDWKPGYPKGTRVTVGYDHAASDPHLAAARQLAEGMNWYGTWIGGDLPEGKCFVCVNQTLPVATLVACGGAFVVAAKEGN